MIELPDSETIQRKTRTTSKKIILTSINHPTKAVQKFSELRDCQLIVVGDKKTPNDWGYENVVFLSVDDQKKLGFDLAEELRFNHYSRKNIGYLYAIQYGAEVIIDTDDDNIPKDNWDIPDFQEIYSTTPKNLGFVNIYKHFSNMHIWPRGFPLDLVQSNLNVLSSHDLVDSPSNVGIWQGLADGDPDVDAIYRLIDNTPCFFESKNPIVLSQGTICPFNSQNTAFKKQLFPLLYLPSSVTFRYTDILRGLVAQPIMWLYNYQLGFTQATVVQERNPHDYMKDFESEIPCYLNPYKVVDIVCNSIKSSLSISDNLCQAYEGLLRANIVTKIEIELVNSWLESLSK